MVNINHPEWDEPREWPGFRARRARLGHQLASERVGASLWEVDPGECAYPYHFHYAEEELLFVLAGHPALRTPGGWQRLAPGDVLRFPAGEHGAHQLHNDTGEVVRFLSVSTHGQPDIVAYPDSGKLCAAERLPDGSGLRTFFRLADQVPYDDGESAPRPGDVDAA